MITMATAARSAARGTTLLAAIGGQLMAWFLDCSDDDLEKVKIDETLSSKGQVWTA